MRRSEDHPMLTPCIISACLRVLRCPGVGLLTRRVGAARAAGRALCSVDYPTAQGRKRMLSSHLEPADARRVFPCWDEPAFKASFALAVTVPRSFLAVSNMPVANEEPVTPTLKQVSFLPTPKMSSYLFVLTAGELERISAQSEGVTINVVTTIGK